MTIWIQKLYALFMMTQACRGGLLNHWKEILSDRIIIVRYEELVRESQQQLPRLLAQSGLDADDNLFNFHQQQGPVLTASVAQVNKPLNDKANGSAEHVIH